MSEEELYKLLNIPNKPWIELTDEEIQLFEKNNNYIKQLQQENTQLKRMLNIKEELDKKGIAYEWDFKDMFDMREENTQLKQQLKDKNEKISKAKQYLEKNFYYCLASGDDITHYIDELCDYLYDNIKDIKIVK